MTGARWRGVGGLALLAAVMLAASEGDAQEKKPKWPVVNTATIFEVDAKWPQRPKEFQWGHVSGIAVDAEDNVYVFTRALPPIQVYDAKGKYLRGWGDKDIDMAHHIRISPAGHVWLTDVGNHTVRKYTRDGKLLLTLGTEGKLGRDETHFNMPTDVAVTKAGDIYVSDGYGNARIMHFDKNGKYLNEWGELGHGPGQFSIPHSLVVDSKSHVYVADRNNVRIQKFDAKGKFQEEWANLMIPWGIHITPNDDLWVCGSSPMHWRKTDGALGCPPKDQIFMKFNTSGRLLQLFALPKGLDGLERPGEVNWVHCVALDSKGNMYLGDIIGRRAQKFLLKSP